MSVYITDMCKSVTVYCSPQWPDTI